ncbi:MAG TPA: TolC family protein [Nitrospiria bacterium]|nr:TolC family protein [Nitrospiria bacterium]
MMKRTFVSIGFLLAVSTASQKVQGETFSLNQVYSLTIQENEQVQIAREDIRVSELDRSRAVSTVLPKVTLTGTYDRYPEKTQDLGGLAVDLQPQYAYGGQIKVEQPLFAGGKNMAGIRIADRQIEAARKSLNLSTEALLIQAAQAYYGMLKSQKNLEAQRRDVERLTEHRRLAELRYKVGEVTESVLLRAEAQLAGAQADLVARENDLAVKRRELRNFADLPEEFEIEDPPLPEIPGGSVSQLLETAAAHRDDLSQSEIREQLSEQQVSFARGNFFPTLSLEGDYFGRNQHPPITFTVNQSWLAEAKIEFPIFEGGLRRAELSQAHGRLNQDRLRTANLRKQLELDVTRSFLNVQAIGREIESREDQLRFAKKNYEMISKQFTFGLATNIDLLDANQTLIEADRDMIEATYDRHLAILDLQRSTGVFLSKALDAAQNHL